MTSRLTQDCLENLFSVVRTKNPTPTPLAFKSALKSICVSQFLKVPNRNESYFNDDREFLADLFRDLPGEELRQPEPDLDEIPVTLADEVSKGEQNGLFYILGYCVNSLRKSSKLCDTCITAIEEKTKAVVGLC